jgi:hypothetical protein
MVFFKGFDTFANVSDRNVLADLVKGGSESIVLC